MEKLRKIRPAVWLALFAIIFVGMRLATIRAFPIFNDESLYVQYSQLIHSDPEGYKFISVHNQFRDWKPPLQYWLGAVVVGLGRDPVLAVRLLTVLISLLGMCGMYLLARELWGVREGLFAAFLYAISPAVLIYDSQFIAEPFLAALAPWFYWSMLRAFGPSKGRWWFLGTAALLGAAILLVKQSGTLILLLALLLPWVSRTDQTEDRARVIRRRVLLALCAILVAMVLPRLIVPLAFWLDSASFNARWVLPLAGLLQLPRDLWAGNVGMVGDYYYHVYSLFAAGLCALFLFRALRRRELAEIGITAMFLWGSLAVIVGLRGFNDYTYNAAVATLILLMLARILAAPLSRPARRVVLALGALLVLNWGYQAGRMMLRPAEYFLGSTAWMRTSYVTNWPTGFGVREVAEFLKQQPGPGIVFADPQWGNPGTSLEVYQEWYPDIRVAKISQQFFDPNTVRELRERSIETYRTRLVIFSAVTVNQRERWQANVFALLCDEKTEIAPAAGQMPIVLCRF